MAIGFLQERNYWDTQFIVGWDFGLVHKHANAIVVTKKISRTTIRFEGGKHWSNISFNIIFQDDDDGNNVVKSSPRCVPINISNSTIQKL